MSLIQAIVLGLVQGLTEFLRISSVAHLRIVPALLGWPDPGAAFSAVIQLGTLGAVLIYFARDIGGMTSAALGGLVRRRPLEDHRARLAWFIVLCTVPIGVCGLAFKKLIKNEFRSLYVIAGSLILLALALEKWVPDTYFRMGEHRSRRHQGVRTQRNATGHHFGT